MKKWIRVGLMIILLFPLILSGCPGQQNKNITKNITIGVTPWTSTIPPTQVARLILEDMGYQVKLQNADVGVVYTGLSKGDINLFMDSWLPDMHRNYMDKYGDKIDDTAISYPNGELGWVIPANIADINSVEDLRGKESLFDNKIYGIEEGAGMSITSREMIDAYNLDLNYAASSESGMLAQARKDISQNNPILFIGWRPHPMFVNWDLKILQEPKEFFKTSEVHVLTNNEFKTEFPEAYAFLKNWSIPVEDVEKMIVKIEEGQEPAEVAREWIDNNQDKVDDMLAK